MLSVIIPVYNVEQTLARCVESVLAQRVSGMEVILVDDGSTDGSSRIVDDYAARQGVRVVHQSNAGLSEARNTGIGMAQGDYVTFVDSDDYLEPDTYPGLLDLLATHTECDILEYSVERETREGHVDITFPEKEYCDMRSYWLDGQAYAHCYAWNKIYRRSLFEKVRYPKGKKFEDVYALSELLKEARCVRTTSMGLYHYTYNPRGITALAEGEAWRDLLHGHLPMVADETLRTYKGFEEYYRHVLNIQLHTFELTGDLQDILLPRLPFRQGWKLKLLQILGMKGLCRLDRLAHKIVG